MATYWLTFRIHDDASYSTRYDGMIAEINKHGTGFWEGPTSFIAMESSATIDIITSSVKKHLSSRDLLVIREITKDNVRYVGTPGDGFDYFFPNAKKA